MRPTVWAVRHRSTERDPDRGQRDDPCDPARRPSIPEENGDRERHEDAGDHRAGLVAVLSTDSPAEAARHRREDESRREGGGAARKLGGRIRVQRSVSPFLRSAALAAEGFGPTNVSQATMPIAMPIQGLANTASGTAMSSATPRSAGDFGMAMAT